MIQSKNKIGILVVSTVLLVTGKPIDLQMGARAFGMGSAFAAISDDGTSTYWNPAGLSKLNAITFSETNWILADVDKVNVNYFSAVFPLSGLGTIAGGWLLQHATLEQGIGDTYRETNWNENSFSLAAGRRLWEKLSIFHRTSVGFSLNRHLISADKDNGAGTGFDLGFLTDFPYGISLGMVAKSIGTDMMGDKIEPEYRMGLGYTWKHPNHRVILAADVATKKDVEFDGGEPVSGFLETNQKAFAGLEYKFIQEHWSLALRGGGNKVLVSDRGNVVITGGAGAGFSGIGMEYSFQTNSKTDKSIGDTHRITIELNLDQLMKMIQGK